MNGRKPVDLVWVGEYYTPTGYGEEARGFIGALDDGRFNLKLVPLSYSLDGMVSPEQGRRFASLEKNPLDHSLATVVHHCHPGLLSEGIAGRFNIARTMFETDRIPEDWVPRCNRMEEIWVPCSFNAETFGNSGIPRQKLRVVPGGVDTGRFNPAAPPLPLGRNGFTFLSVFDWTGRKGWEILLTAYCTEFGAEEEVLLLIKTCKIQDAGRPIDEQLSPLINRLAARKGALPRFRVLDCHLPESSLPGLYTACDAFVLPSRGEAWGRPYIEAMACGLPTIGARWSGNLEFMNDDNSYLIEIEGLEDVPGNAENYIYQGHRWSRPSVEHLRQLMRHVFEHRREARARGERARADICAKWTFHHAAAAARRELLKYCNL